MNEPKRIVLVDADLITFRYAAASEVRSVSVKHIKSGKEKVFKNRTEFKDMLKAKDFEYKPDDYIITDIQTPSDTSIFIKQLDSLVTKLKEFTWADSIEFYLGKGETFRQRLPFPSPYKGNRKDSIRPINLELFRNYLLKKYNCSLIFDIEVDDMVTIRAYEELEKGNYPIIASVDKDAYQSSGCQILDWTKEEWELVSIPDVGTLYRDETLKSKPIKGTGLKFLAFQCLAGDNADCYSGYELSKVKYGEAKAKKALDDAVTEKEVLEIMIGQFKMLYPEPFEYTDCFGEIHSNQTWYDMLQLYWKAAYMMRFTNDSQTFKDFALSKGLDVESAL